MFVILWLKDCFNSMICLLQASMAKYGAASTLILFASPAILTEYLMATIITN